ncbi:hypothetical protein D3C86_1031540 [compost metagenome]
MITAPCGVLIEVLRVLSALQQPLTCQAFGRDSAGRGNVVGGDVVAQHHQDPCTADRQAGFRFGLDPREVLRTTQVGRIRAPGKLHTAFGRQRLPMVSAVPDRRQALLEKLRPDHLDDLSRDFCIGRHQVSQINRLTIVALAQRLRFKVDIDGPGDGIGDAQRRRCQIPCGHFRIDPTFVVTVAGKHHHAFQALIGEHFDMLFQLPGVADAGHATEPRQVKTQRREIFKQAGLGQIIRHHL